jgi:hypothetical protein
MPAMPKRKSPHLRPRRKADHSRSLDATDQALDSCRKIRALAELLFRCNAQLLRADSVAIAGGLILEEIAKLSKGVEGGKP